MQPLAKHPLGKLLLLGLYFVAGIFVAQFVVLASLFPIMGAKALQLGEYLNDPESYPGFQAILLYIQGTTSFISMIVAPYFFIIHYYNKGKIHVIHHQPEQIFFLATVLLVIFAMPSIAYIADWNRNMVFPDFLQGFYTWATEKEESLKVITEYITNFNDVYGFLAGLLVIALLPAVGEELLFRGCLQNILKDYTKNAHVAIWVSAIIFSAIHLQFFGFFPRMLLGALFGYLYVWTGSLLIPITGHFVNNGFTLFLIYMKDIGALKIDLESSNDVPLSTLLISLALFLVLIAYFYWEIHKKREGKPLQHTLDNFFNANER